MELLCTNNVKVKKGLKFGYLNAILHLAPADSSGYQVCPKHSKGCKRLCLNMSGRGRFNMAQAARIRKTRMLFEDPDTFFALLKNDIREVERKAERQNLIPVIRFNGTSDLPFETAKFRCLFKEFPHIQFYDYTKILKRCEPNSIARSIPNYHLTFSQTESNWKECLQALKYGVNVASVFDLKSYGGDFPKIHKGIKVINGDLNDLRFLDPKGVIVGLRYKMSFDHKTGKALYDTSGFVIRDESRKQMLKIAA